MATTLSGWTNAPASDMGGSSVAARTENPNPLVVKKETFTFGTGTTDVYGTPIDFIPAGVDFTVLFVQNNTMSAAGDIVVQGSLDQTNWVTLKDNCVQYSAAADTPGQHTYGLYDVSANGEAPYYRLFLDGDGAHSASTGTDKTADLYVMFAGKSLW